MGKKKKRILHIMLVIVLIALGATGMVKLTQSKPQIQKRQIDVPAPIVRIKTVHTGPQQVLVSGEGIVSPLKEINLVPQVGGKVIYVSPTLINGGTFQKGDTLIRIDPKDYELALTLARARVKDSESMLKMTEEEAAAAEEEWHLLHEDDGKSRKKPPPLVIKAPQLAAAKAKLAADRANLEKAALDLSRTTLKAPFDGRVSEEHVDVGQYVTPGQSVASLYSIDAAEVAVPLEDRDLQWFRVPGFTSEDQTGSPAMVEADVAGKRLSWSGKVVRSEGKLDQRTRMIRVVVRVEHPYAKKPPLTPGLFVTVRIQGETLPHAAVVTRSSLRANDVIWVVGPDHRLRFRQVEVARKQGDMVVIRSGLEDGDRVVISHLQAVTDGMAVRTLSDPKENRS